MNDSGRRYRTSIAVLAAARALLVALSLTLLLTTFACADGGQAAALTDPLPVTAPDGDSVDLSLVPGWRVLYFWSSVCPCVRACERYSFVPLAEKYRGKVAFFAIASDGWDLNKSPTELQTDIKMHHLPYPVLLDTSHQVAETLNAKVTPETFVLDPQGDIVFQGMPDDSRRFLYQLMNPTPKKPLPVPQTFLAKALAEGLSGRPITPTPIKESGCIIAW